jgi:hypothetical protein
MRRGKTRTLDATMAARREANIYLGYAVVGTALTAYVVDRLVMLVQRPFAPLDVVLIAAVVIVLLAFTVFYAVLAFVFAVRFIDRIREGEGSLLLHRSNGTLIQVNGNVRVVRRFGRHFSSNERQSAFALFLANGHLWVSTQEEIPNGV